MLGKQCYSIDCRRSERIVLRNYSLHVFKGVVLSQMVNSRDVSLGLTFMCSSALTASISIIVWKTAIAGNNDPHSMTLMVRPS